MKLILFGGAEVNLGQVVPELKLIEKAIKEQGAKQILHIPFARTIAREVEWREGWFQRHIHIPKAQYLNAQNKADIQKAKDPLIFISGGSESANLIDKINANSRLLDLIKKSSCLIGESAGSKVVGEYLRSGRADGEQRMLKGLGIVKDTVIVVHYTERKRQKQLIWEMEQTNAKYGIGIDAMTAIEFEIDKFPDEYKVIGTGRVEIKKNDNIKFYGKSRSQH